MNKLFLVWLLLMLLSCQSQSDKRPFYKDDLFFKKSNWIDSVSQVDFGDRTFKISFPQEKLIPSGKMVCRLRVYTNDEFLELNFEKEVKSQPHKIQQFIFDEKDISKIYCEVDGEAGTYIDDESEIKRKFDSCITELSNWYSVNIDFYSENFGNTNLPGQSRVAGKFNVFSQYIDRKKSNVYYKARFFSLNRLFYPEYKTQGFIEIGDTVFYKTNIGYNSLILKDWNEIEQFWW